MTPTVEIPQNVLEQLHIIHARGFSLATCVSARLALLTVHRVEAVQAARWLLANDEFYASHVLPAFNLFQAGAA